MNVRYVVTLTEVERDESKVMVAKRSKLARKVKKAQVLLAAAGGASDEEIARLVIVGTSTVYRLKRRFVEDGVAAALSNRPRPGAERKLSGKDEALLMATACSKPPPGRARWTLELLAGELVPWQKKMWCVPAIDAEYVARMEGVLDLYTEPPDPSFPVICFDESPTQLIGRVPGDVENEKGAFFRLRNHQPVARQGDDRRNTPWARLSRS